MKKLLASFATGIIIAGAAVSTVSAEEYQVQEGDNLWQIANEYNTTVEDLVAINELKSTTIHPKQNLFINEMYEVQSGDTLSSIGNEFDVSIENIKEWNKLDSDLIVVGQELTVKGVNVDKSHKPATKVEKKETEKAAPKKEEKSTESSNTQNTTSAASKQEDNESDESPQGKTVSVKATAYTADCAGCSGITSTGVDLNANPNAKVIAVDPNVIPLGSKVHVEGYGYATAADIGGAIKGNRIDVHVPTKDEAYNWGVRNDVKVTIVE
jgi:3D (Asp-Asp-Asp) domain-containing protein/LysM repeat protein